MTDKEIMTFHDYKKQYLPNLLKREEEEEERKKIAEKTKQAREKFPTDKDTKKQGLGD